MGTQTRSTTDLLQARGVGEGRALDALVGRVYGRLAALAGSLLRCERRGHTLDTAALVHETYLRLAGQRRDRWESRSQFFAVAARLMRRVLVDHARRYLYAKRGAGQRPLALDEALTLAPERAPELIALDDALARLAVLAPVPARMVELRFFGGLSRAEIAAVLGVSVPTVTRGLRTARSWLYLRLAEASPHGR